MEGWTGTTYYYPHDPWTIQGVAAGKPIPTPIESATDVDLIMELMKRGYAVWKPPVGE